VEPIVPAVSDAAAVPAAVKISLSTHKKGSNKLYRLQVGSFLISANAVRAFNRLENAGLQPVYEKYGKYTRVVLPDIREKDISLYTEKINAAGFREIWRREER
jgi:cell division protein FtsN